MSPTSQEQGYSKSEAARSLGINANVLGRGIKEHETADEQAFRGNGKLTPVQAEIRQLREENRRLKMEHEILKKATVDSLPKKRAEIRVQHQHKKTGPVGVMSRLLGVSPNADYRYRQRQRNSPPDSER